VPATVVDDHLLRDILVGRRDETLDGLAPDGVATTGLWLFRLCSSFAAPTVVGTLPGPVASLPEDMQARFRAQLVALPPSIEVLSLRAWPGPWRCYRVATAPADDHDRGPWSRRSPPPTGSARRSPCLTMMSDRTFVPPPRQMAWHSTSCSGGLA